MKRARGSGPKARLAAISRISGRVLSAKSEATAQIATDGPLDAGAENGLAGGSRQTAVSEVRATLSQSGRRLKRGVIWCLAGVTSRAVADPGRRFITARLPPSGPPS